MRSEGVCGQHIKTLNNIVCGMFCHAHVNIGGPLCVHHIAYMLSVKIRYISMLYVKEYRVILSTNTKKW